MPIVDKTQKIKAKPRKTTTNDSHNINYSKKIYAWMQGKETKRKKEERGEECYASDQTYKYRAQGLEKTDEGEKRDM